MDRLGEKCKKDLSKLFTKIVKANPVNFWYLTFGYEQHNGEENQSLNLSFIFEAYSSPNPWNCLSLKWDKLENRFREKLLANRTF